MHARYDTRQALSNTQASTVCAEPLLEGLACSSEADSSSRALATDRSVDREGGEAEGTPWMLGLVAGLEDFRQVDSTACNYTATHWAAQLRHTRQP